MLSHLRVYYDQVLLQLGLYYIKGEILLHLGLHYI